jgi:two-component system, NarL family, sensor histidine kinase DegS
MDFIRFMENLSVQLYEFSQENDIYDTIERSFLERKDHSGTVVLLLEEGSTLTVSKLALSQGLLVDPSKAAGIPIKWRGIDANQSTVFSGVVQEEKTVLVKFKDLLHELSPCSTHGLVLRSQGPGELWFALVPIRQQGRISGIFGVASPEPVDVFRQSAENLSRHLSTALDMALQRQRLNESTRVLKQSEEKYRILFESAGVPIVYYSIDGTIQFINTVGAALVGQIPETCVGRGVHEIFPNVAEAFLKAIGKIAETCQGAEFEVELTTVPWKGSRSFICDLQPVFDAEHNVCAIQTVSHDITEQKHLRENMQVYIAGITKAHEEERRRIARELHDETVQSITMVSLEAQSIISNCKGFADDADQRLQRLLAMSDSALDSVRRICHNLRPELLDQLGLIPALELIADETTTQSQLEISFWVEGQPHRLSRETEMEMFRIAQEAVRNAVKHSRPTEIMMQLKFSADQTELVISDNGSGTTIPQRLSDLANMGKLGLIGMQERARLMGGMFVIKSKRGKGTTVSVVLPT